MSLTLRTAKIVIFVIAMICMAFAVLAEARSVKVGVNIPLTGSIASIGTAIKNGIEIARVDHPEVFEGISFLYRDNQDDAKLALTAFRQFNDIDTVDIQFLSANGAEVITPVAEQSKRVLILFGFPPKPAQGKRYVFRNMNYSAQYSRRLLETIREQKISRLQIIKAENQFFNSMISGLQENLRPDETLEVIASVDFQETDFRSSIWKLKTQGIKSVGLFLLPHQIDSFCKQAVELDFRPYLYGTDLFETAAKLRRNPLIEGAVYPDNEVTKEFRARYLSEYHTEEQITFAANSYDVARIVAGALKGSASSTADHIADALRHTGPNSGALGPYAFKDDIAGGQFFEYPLVVKAIRDGRGEVL